MGRKRNQGKARRAAKAKARARAREAEEEEERNYQTTTYDNERQEQQVPEAEAEAEVQMQQLQIGNDAPIADTDTDNYVLTCRHGLIPLSNSTCTDFMLALKMSYRKAITNDPRTASCLIDAENSTKVEFAEVWKDTNMMELAISCFLCLGTETMLNGKYDCARETATLTRYLEQRNSLQKTQAVMNLAKIEELALCSSDDHTLVKFYRRRIPCSCLDKKYEEVKSVAKIGVCFNAQCPFPDGLLERSLTMYCSRCRSVTYCSLECQKDQWTNHRDYCDNCVVLKADFEAKQQQQQQQQQS